GHALEAEYVVAGRVDQTVVGRGAGAPVDGVVGALRVVEGAEVDRGGVGGGGEGQRRGAGTGHRGGVQHRQRRQGRVAVVAAQHHRTVVERDDVGVVVRGAHDHLHGQPDRDRVAGGPAAGQRGIRAGRGNDALR